MYGHQNCRQFCFVFQATEVIRDGGSVNRDTPIIAVTANAMEGDRDKVLHRLVPVFRPPSLT